MSKMCTSPSPYVDFGEPVEREHRLPCRGEQKKAI